MTLFINTWYWITLLVAGQLSPEEEFNSIKALYPEEPVVYMEKRQELEYELSGDSIITTLHIYEETFHLDENTIRYAGETVYSSNFNNVSNLKAYTLVPGKRKYERINVTDFKESFDDDSYVFFDDTKKISFNFPGIVKGAKTVLEYEISINDPRWIGPFYFESYTPIRDARYTVTYDPEISIMTQFFNENHVNFKVEVETMKNGKKIHKIEASNIDKLQFESNAPSFKSLVASVYTPITSYRKSDGSDVPVISDAENLHSWYRSFIKNIQGRDKGIERLVNSIVDPGDPDLVKIKKIYNWVQANIKYIAFEDGMRGVIPHPGNYVIEKRYGDCKDMASTIVAMLREAGVEAQYTWIGTRKLPYSYTQTPSPITDNHMIASVEQDGQIYFLDATGSYSPLDLPTSMIQGKECLISYNDKVFKIVKVPEISRERNLITDTVEISLVKGTITGSGKATLAGYAKVDATYRLIKSNPKKVDEYLQKALQKGSNKFILGTYELKNLEDLESPTGISYHFSIPDYYQEINETIYINPVLDKSMTEAILKDRKQPLENDYKFIHRDVTILDIPEGYSYESLPEIKENSNKNFGYRIEYTTRENEIIVTKEFFVDYLVMPVGDFEKWNELISEYAKACRNAIILKKQ